MLIFLCFICLNKPLLRHTLVPLSLEPTDASNYTYFRTLNQEGNLLFSTGAKAAESEVLFPLLQTCLASLELSESKCSAVSQTSSGFDSTRE
jgi:hypothetical protein